jgi:hypothetical protein
LFKNPKALNPKPLELKIFAGSEAVGIPEKNAVDSQCP